MKSETREQVLYQALLTAFQQVREGGTFVPQFSVVDVATMAQSIDDSLNGK